MSCGRRQVEGRAGEGGGHGQQATAAAEPGHVPQQDEGDVGHVPRHVEEDGEAGGLGLAEVVQPGAGLFGRQVERELEHEDAGHVGQEALRVLQAPGLLPGVGRNALVIIHTVFLGCFFRFSFLDIHDILGILDILDILNIFFRRSLSLQVN